MSKELVVSATNHETRVATLDDDQLVEISIERAAERALAGSIYKGRVSRVLPGMQSAFVKIGLERDAFLYVDDVIDQTAEIERQAAEEPDLGPSDGGSAARGAAVVEEAPAAGETGDDEGDARRGRRGRRSRRRRGGGRNPDRFPESKYAALDEAPWTAATAATAVEAEPEPTAEAPEPFEDGPDEQADDIAVLPGESLAKYGSRPRVDNDGVADSGRASAADEEETDDQAEDDEADDVATAFDDIDDPFDREREDDADDAEDSDDPHLERRAAVDEEDSDEENSDERDSDDEESDDERDGELVADSEAPAREARVEDRDRDSRPLRRGRRGRRRRGRRGRPSEEASTEASSEARVAAPAEGRHEAPVSTEAPGAAGDATERPAAPMISDLLKPGQEIIVQIAKEPLGKKGARITAHVALPGRFLVYMPTVAHVGVSRKIGSDAERARLRRTIKEHQGDAPGGFIVRTAAQGASDDDLIADVRFLIGLWRGVQERAEKRGAPAVLHQDLDVVERILRDQVGRQFKTIWVDNELYYERVVRFIERFQPDLLDRVKLYTRSTPIFDEFGITQEIEKALRPKVWLKSGGYIVINQTEALVAIDVNTGKYVGKSDRLEDTIVKTNIEAVQEVVRQIRLRDLGGIIVVDFIDMDDKANRKKVTQALENELRHDRAPSKALSFNDFGLVAITRKRVKQSLEKTLCSPCPTCAGAGHVKSVETVIGDILTEARKIAPKREPQSKDLVLRVNPDVARTLKSRDNSYLQELEEILNANVLVRGDLSLHRENFDIN